jgi:enolase-phosphatase E1
LIRAIVTDIEGTTSSIAFVHEVLFPYARRELAAFVRERLDEAAVARELMRVRSEMGRRQAPLDDVVAQLAAWMAEDRKIGPLKALQGMIWERGYRAGDFRGHVYPDAERELRRWSQSGIELYVYSSGSVAAQRLLFEHSEQGDLRPLFSGYFDTDIGGKRDRDSYVELAAQVPHPVHTLLFLSDSVEELDAAAAAGLHCCELRRDGAAPSGRHAWAIDFVAVSRHFALGSR